MSTNTEVLLVYFYASCQPVRAGNSSFMIIMNYELHVFLFFLRLNILKQAVCELNPDGITDQNCVAQCDNWSDMLDDYCYFFLVTMRTLGSVPVFFFYFLFLFRWFIQGRQVGFHRLFWPAWLHPEVRLFISVPLIGFLHIHRVGHTSWREIMPENILPGC